jgi:hypothetical protein
MFGIDISIPLFTLRERFGYYFMFEGRNAVTFYWHTIFLIVFFIWSLLKDRFAAGEFSVLDLLRE